MSEEIHKVIDREEPISREEGHAAEPQEGLPPSFADFYKEDADELGPSDFSLGGALDKSDPEPDPAPPTQPALDLAPDPDSQVPPSAEPEPAAAEPTTPDPLESVQQDLATALQYGQMQNRRIDALQAQLQQVLQLVQGQAALDYEAAQAGAAAAQPSLNEDPEGYFANQNQAIVNQVQAAVREELAAREQQAQAAAQGLAQQQTQAVVAQSFAKSEQEIREVLKIAADRELAAHGLSPNDPRRPQVEQHLFNQAQHIGMQAATTGRDPGETVLRYARATLGLPAPMAPPEAGPTAEEYAARRQGLGQARPATTAGTPAGARPAPEETGDWTQLMADFDAAVKRRGSELRALGDLGNT